MPTIKGPYWQFYLMGRGRKRPPNAEIDDDIDKMVNDGGDFRDVVRARCEAAVKEWATGRRYDAFLKDCADEIQKAGGDTVAAWDAYLAGVTDEIAYGIERDAVETLESVVYDEDEDDEDDDDDEDDSDDDDDDDD